MSKHTPGPWEIIDSSPDDDYIVATMANIKDESIGVGVGFGIHNANLIAAAPELLEVLVRALPEISVCATEDILEQARSAIAKATGETK